MLAERAEKEQAFIAQAVTTELAKFEEPLREQLRAALDTPADQRTDQQKQLLDANPSVNVTPGVLYQYLPQAAEELKSFDAKAAEIRATKPAETFVRWWSLLGMLPMRGFSIGATMSSRSKWCSRPRRW